MRLIVLKLRICFRFKTIEYKSALFIHSENGIDKNFKMASANIPKVSILNQKGINVKDIITLDKIFIEKNSVNEITKRLAWRLKIKIFLEKAYDIIKKPITTEKSTNLQQFNQYSFVVSKNANSFEIKNAIEIIFKVKVNKVNTSILRGKGKTFKGQYGFRKDSKRAIVTLEEGNTIDSSLEIK